jgi:hypothetical protein
MKFPQQLGHHLQEPVELLVVTLWSSLVFF